MYLHADQVWHGTVSTILCTDPYIDTWYLLWYTTPIIHDNKYGAAWGMDPYCDYYAVECGPFCLPPCPFRTVPHLS